MFCSLGVLINVNERVINYGDGTNQSVVKLVLKDLQINKSIQLVFKEM